MGAGRKLTSLRTVARNEWLFKVSEMDGTICVISFNCQFHWSNVRFFDDEKRAQLHVDYLCLTTEQHNANPG